MSDPLEADSVDEMIDQAADDPNSAAIRAASTRVPGIYVFHLGQAFRRPPGSGPAAASDDPISRVWSGAQPYFPLAVEYLTRGEARAERIAEAVERVTAEAERIVHRRQAPPYRVTDAPETGAP